MGEILLFCFSFFLGVEGRAPLHNLRALRALRAALPQACADKLRRELESYGNPPRFPEDVEEEVIEEVSWSLLYY